MYVLRDDVCINSGCVRGVYLCVWSRTGECVCVCECVYVYGACVCVCVCVYVYVCVAEQGSVYLCVYGAWSRGVCVGGCMERMCMEQSRGLYVYGAEQGFVCVWSVCAWVGGWVGLGGGGY